MSRFFTQKLTYEELAEKIWNKALETEGECEWAEMGRYYRKDSSKCKTFVSKCYASQLPIPYFSGRVHEDLLKVQFDWENYEYNPKETYMNSKNIGGFRTLPNGLTFLGVTAGGDWQVPTFAILYFSGKELRAYIPTNGNVWNTDTHEAYGNDNLADAKNIAKRFKPELNKKIDGMDEYDDGFYDDLNFDENKIIADIENRIKYKAQK